MPEKLYTLAEVRELLNLSRPTIWRRIKAGELQVIRLGPRSPRFAASEIARIQAEGWSRTSTLPEGRAA